MLPYLEQQSLFNAANFSLNTINGPAGVWTNSTALTTRINGFLCPSDTAPSWPDITVVAARATGVNYFASVGSSLEFNSSMTGGPPNGIFGYIPPTGGVLTTPASISDGTSNTIAFGEWRVGDGNDAIITVPSDIIFVGAYPPGVTRNTPLMTLPAGAAPFQLWTQACTSAILSDRTSNHTSELGMGWAWGLPGFTIGNTVSAPNPKYPNCSVDTASDNTIWNPGMWTFSSHHPGGANAVFADGSVRFLKDTTSLPVIWALGSRAQGEVISADSY